VVVAVEPGYLVFYPTVAAAVAVAAADGDGDTCCPCSRFVSHGRLDCFAHFDHPVDHSVPSHHLGSTQNPRAHDAGYHCFHPAFLVVSGIVAAVGKAFRHDVP